MYNNLVCMLVLPLPRETSLPAHASQSGKSYQSLCGMVPAGEPAFGAQPQPVASSGGAGQAFQAAGDLQVAAGSQGSNAAVGPGAGEPSGDVGDHNALGLPLDHDAATEHSSREQVFSSATKI